MTNLQRLRLKKGLSIPELAKETGISEDAIRGHESHKGYITWHGFKKLADFFGVRIMELQEVQRCLMGNLKGLFSLFTNGQTNAI